MINQARVQRIKNLIYLGVLLVPAILLIVLFASPSQRPAGFEDAIEQSQLSYAQASPPSSQDMPLQGLGRQDSASSATPQIPMPSNVGEDVSGEDFLSYLMPGEADDTNPESNSGEIWGNSAAPPKNSIEAPPRQNEPDGSPIITAPPYGNVELPNTGIRKRCWR